MWDNITSTDIEQAKVDLNLRRAEMLARHAVEIEQLNADQSEVDQLAQVIAAFVSKYKNGNETVAGDGESPPAANEVEDQTSAQPTYNRYSVHAAGMNRNFG